MRPCSDFVGCVARHCQSRRRILRSDSRRQSRSPPQLGIDPTRLLTELPGASWNPPLTRPLLPSTTKYPRPYLGRRRKTGQVFLVCPPLISQDPLPIGKETMLG